LVHQFTCKGLQRADQLQHKIEKQLFAGYQLPRPRARLSPGQQASAQTVRLPTSTFVKVASEAGKNRVSQAQNDVSKASLRQHCPEEMLLAMPAGWEQPERVLWGRHAAPARCWLGLLG